MAMPKTKKLVFEIFFLYILQEQLVLTFIFLFSFIFFRHFLLVYHGYLLSQGKGIVLGIKTILSKSIIGLSQECSWYTNLLRYVHTRVGKLMLHQLLTCKIIKTKKYKKPYKINNSTTIYFSAESILCLFSESTTRQLHKQAISTIREFCVTQSTATYISTYLEENDIHVKLPGWKNLFLTHILIFFI